MFIDLSFKQYEGFKTQMFHMQDVQTANRIFTSRNCTEEEKYKVEEEIKFQKLWEVRSINIVTAAKLHSSIPQSPMLVTITLTVRK